jgi:hypothetical protein
VLTKSGEEQEPTMEAQTRRAPNKERPVIAPRQRIRAASAMRQASELPAITRDRPQASASSHTQFARSVSSRAPSLAPARAPSRAPSEAPHRQPNDLDDAASDAFSNLSVDPSIQGGRDVLAPFADTINRMKRKAETSGDPLEALKLLKGNREIERANKERLESELSMQAAERQRLKDELKVAKERERAFSAAFMDTMKKTTKGALMEFLDDYRGGGDMDLDLNDSEDEAQEEAEEDGDGDEGQEEAEEDGDGDETEEED